MNEEKAILVIDDSNSALLLLEYALNEAGYATFLASSVKRAIELLDSIIPALVLLDLSMPEISGYDFLRMRTSLHIENTPIIIISAHGSEESVKQALKLGAKDFVSKPIHIDSLLEKVKINIL